MTMTRTLFALGLPLAAIGVVAAAVGATASCSQTPTNLAVRTFELAQKMDVVCMQVNDANGNGLPDAPIPVAKIAGPGGTTPPQYCAPVAANTSGGPLPLHLYAVVTQLARGELAVVDMTNGNVVDEDRATPGINFIPVGPTPTDVVVAPDATMTFVASGDASKPAIYGIPNTRLLGDAVGSPPQPPLKLTDLLACALPQVPQALTVAPVGGGRFVLVAMLRAGPAGPAAIAAIDPGPLLGGANLDDAGPGVVPGSLGACTILGATALSGAVPPSWAPGPAWPDGVPYVEGGVNLADAQPSLGPTCTASPGDAGVVDGGGAQSLAVAAFAQPNPVAMVMRDDVPLLYVADGALPMVHVIDVSNPTAPVEEPPLLATSVLEPTRAVTVGALALSPPTRDFRRYLYAVDASVHSTVMVYDVTDPASTERVPMQRPHAELNPFLPPDRIIFSAPVAALAFVQHDWPLPSQIQGSNPVNQFSGLLCNPNQFAHPDGGTFADLGAYYRADEATVIQSSGSDINFPQRLRGIFAFVTLSNGSISVVDVDDWDAPCRRPDPMSSDPDVKDIGGAMFPGPMSGLVGVLDVTQPSPTSSADLDPYHTPLSYNGAIAESAGTTIEAFFPVSAPNRLRSNFLLRNDPMSGFHVPNITSPVLLYDVNGAPLPTSGAAGVVNPLLLPTPLAPGFVDPSRIQNPTEANPASRTALVPGLASFALQQTTVPSPILPGPMNPTGPDIRISFDDPTAHVDQDWTVTYEGALPTVSGLEVDIASFDGDRTLTLSSGAFKPDAGAAEGGASSIGPSFGFCERGIEDFALGQERANAALAALATANAELQAQGQPPLPQPGMCGAGGFTLPNWTSDYVEFADDLLASTDQYWGTPSSPENDCWDPPLADPDGFTGKTSPHAQDRYNACYAQFNSLSNGDTFYARDFPILEAFDDHLVLGRYGWLVGSGTTQIAEQPNNRVVVGPDDSNQSFLRLARCCFHRQGTFKVRTGGEWVVVGSVAGLLNHVQTDPATRRCVLSCNPNDVLKNARTFDVPWGSTTCAPDMPPVCTPPAAPPPSLDRNSTLALRNPMFSFIMWSGCGPLHANDHTETARDMQWRLSLRGGFSPLTLTIAQGTNAVAPQTMRFIDSLGQLAIVDGSQQGLVLFDLNSLAFAEGPFF
jgi:hypothetical protein